MSSADYSGLVPGHKHVESFSEDLEEEYEEEARYELLHSLFHSLNCMSDDLRDFGSRREFSKRVSWRDIVQACGS